jgi:hypothetical protein
VHGKGGSLAPRGQGSMNPEHGAGKKIVGGASRGGHTFYKGSQNKYFQLIGQPVSVARSCQDNPGPYTNKGAWLFQ